MYQFNYLKIMVHGLRGSLFKSRICLPYFMERQCDLEIHPGAAPQEPLNRDGSRSCLSGGRLLAGMGAFDTLSRIFDASFEKRPPLPFNSLLVFSKR